MNYDNLKYIIINFKKYEVDEESDHYHIKPSENVIRKNDDFYFRIGNIGFAKNVKKGIFSKHKKNINKIIKLMERCK